MNLLKETMENQSVYNPLLVLLCVLMISFIFVSLMSILFYILDQIHLQKILKAIRESTIPRTFFITKDRVLEEFYHNFMPHEAVMDRDSK